MSTENRTIYFFIMLMFGFYISLPSKTIVLPQGTCSTTLFRISSLKIGCSILRTGKYPSLLIRSKQSSIDSCSSTMNFLFLGLFVMLISPFHTALTKIRCPKLSLNCPQYNIKLPCSVANENNSFLVYTII
jgi:hypothetical protein